MRSLFQPGLSFQHSSVFTPNPEAYHQSITNSKFSRKKHISQISEGLIGTLSHGAWSHPPLQESEPGDVFSTVSHAFRFISTTRLTSSSRRSCIRGTMQLPQTNSCFTLNQPPPTNSTSHQVYFLARDTPRCASLFCETSSAEPLRPDLFVGPFTIYKATCKNQHV